MPKASLLSPKLGKSLSLALLCSLALLLPVACDSAAETSDAKPDAAHTDSSKSETYKAAELVSDQISAALAGDKARRLAQAVVSGGASTKADAYLSKLAAQGKFNGVALIAIDHNIVLKKAYGYQDIRSKKPMTTASCFNLASISKPITATAVLMLADAGKLSLDDDISEYFPNLGYEDITVKHLLTHTSGLPEYFDLAQEHWGEGDGIMSNRDVLKLLSEHGGEPEFKPGSKYEYNNSGYALLALIIEKASGQKYPDFLTSKIFKPLGMNSTFVLTPQSINRKDPCRVYAYSRSGKNLAPDEIGYLDGIHGDGGVISTADDIFRFDQALYAGKLLKPATLKQAFTAFKVKGKSTGYGYGWDVYAHSVGHTGSWEGFQNSLTRYIEVGDTTLLLTSVDNENNDEIQEAIEAYYE